MSWSVHFVPKRPDQSWDDAHAAYDAVAEDPDALGSEALAAGRRRQQQLVDRVLRAFPTFERVDHDGTVVLEQEASGIEVWVEPFGLSLAAPHGGDDEGRTAVLQRLADLVVEHSDLRCEELEDDAGTPPPAVPVAPARAPAPSAPSAAAPATSPKGSRLGAAAVGALVLVAGGGFGVDFLREPYVPGDARAPDDTFRTVFDAVHGAGGSGAVVAVLFLAAAAGAVVAVVAVRGLLRG